MNLTIKQEVSVDLFGRLLLRVQSDWYQTWKGGRGDPRSGTGHFHFCAGESPLGTLLAAR